MPRLRETARQSRISFNGCTLARPLRSSRVFRLNGTRIQGSFTRLKLEVTAAPCRGVAAPDAKTLVNGKPERMAWLVLFGAFFACIVLTLLVPVLGFQFVRFSTVPVNASLQAAPLRANEVAPVRVILPNVTLPLAVIDPTSITENSRVETDNTENSRAFMTFFDNSTATIYKNSRIVLNELRQPQFGMSEQPNSIVIEQPRGVVRYGVASPLAFAAGSGVRPTQFLVRTPHFDAWLNPGRLRPRRDRHRLAN